MDEERKEAIDKMRNPALMRAKEKAVALEAGEVATVKGSFGKVALLLLGLFAATGVSCFMTIGGRTVIALVLLTFGVSMYIAFHPQYTAELSAPYVVLEGIVLGQIVTIQERLHPGIGIQTLVITFVIAAIVAAAYMFHWVEVNQVFKSSTFLATIGIAIVYVIDLVLMLGFDMQVPMIHENNWKGILASVLVIYVAARNLVWDLDDICSLSAKGLPKYYEWYFGFSLVITLIWLYVEIAQLLRKIARL